MGNQPTGTTNANASGGTSSNVEKSTVQVDIISPLLAIGTGASLGTGWSFVTEPDARNVKLRVWQGSGAGLLGLGAYTFGHAFRQDDPYSEAALFACSGSSLKLGDYILDVSIQRQFGRATVSGAMKRACGGGLFFVGAYGAVWTFLNAFWWSSSGSSKPKRDS